LADPAKVALEAELEQLELEEREISLRRRNLHDRIDRGFPNESLLEEEKRVSTARRELHARIDVLRARLALMS
jgi:hypothetical protein